MKQNPCRYCVLSSEHNGKHYSSIHHECIKCKNFKLHMEYLKSQRKYEKGETIKQLDVLLKQKFVFWGYSDTVKHIEMIKCQQLRIVLQCLERGSFYMAVKKESEEKII